MNYSIDELFLLRKEKIGWISLISWALGCFTVQPLMFTIAWIFGAIWIGMDASYRKMSVFWWVALYVCTVPVGLMIYLLTRRPMPGVCYQCGCSLSFPMNQCSNCGYKSFAGRAMDGIKAAYAGSAQSLENTPASSSRNAVAYMAAACGIFFFIGITRSGFTEVLASLAAAAYWILVAYWVYLDARWRRMDALPWTVLTLLTNLVGFATYLVIRHPNPTTCPQCSAPLNEGLKHCPYCGAEVVLVCPRCQSQVQPGWVFCPACAAQLPGETPSEVCDEQPSPIRASVSIRGNVTDAERGTPLVGAEIKIDSRTMKESAVTDPVGRFVLVDLEPKPYVLIASSEGYVSQTRPFQPDPTKSIPVNFTLSRRPEQKQNGSDS